MTLAYVKTETRGETDVLLSAFADHLAKRGERLSGVVQTNTPCIGTHHCDMDVQVLPDGPIIRISQSLGANSRGCRLDPSALEQAVGLVSPTISGSPDILILNKFGKHEAEGRGFRPLIADALMAEIPVLTAVNGINEADFLEFADGLAVNLEPTLAELSGWFASLKMPAAKSA